MTDQKHALNRRDFLRASAITVTGLAAIACAPAATQAPAAAEPTKAPAAAEPTKAPEAPAPAPTPTTQVQQYGKADKETVMWTGLGGADGATFQTMLGMYADKNAGTAVRSETYGWDTLYQKLPTSVAAGTPPDMTIFHETEIEQFTRQGLLSPLDDIMYASKMIPVDDYNAPVIGAVTIDGKKMCVPWDNHGWLAYVNTKVIKAAGLDPEKLPKNGAEFIEFAQKVTVDEAGKHPNEAGFNKDKVKVWALHSSWQRFTIPSTWRQFGQGIITDDKKKSLIGTDAGVAAIQYWYDLMYKYFVVPPAVPGTASSYDMYKTDSLAIMWDGSWSLGFFKDNPDVEAHTIGKPLNSLAPDGKAANKIGIHTMSIPAGVKDDGVKRASTLMKWLSDNSEFWATSGQVPARLTAQKSKTVQDIWSTKAAAAAFSSIGVPDVGHKAYTEIQLTWEAAAGAALAKTTPVKDAMADGQKQVQAILDRP